jgi:hypothetical protein
MRPVEEVALLSISPELLKSATRPWKLACWDCYCVVLAIGSTVLMKMVVKSKNNGNVEALLLELGVFVVARLLNTYWLDCYEELLASKVFSTHGWDNGMN